MGTTVSFSSIARSRTRDFLGLNMPGHIKLVRGAVDPDPTEFLLPSMDMKKARPLWVNIENGAQLCLEEEMPGKEEQLWDYEEFRSSGIFRSKTGLVADMKGSVGPELICWPHHGGPNQKFEIKDEIFIHCEIDDKVWDVKGGRLTPGGPLILWPKHGGPNQQFRFRGKDSR